MFPFCKEMKLNPVRAHQIGGNMDRYFIEAEEVEELFRKGTRVGGNVLPNNSKHPSDIEVGVHSGLTHQGILVGYSEIPRKVKVKTLLEAYKAAVKSNDAKSFMYLDVVMQKIESNGIE